MDTLVKNRLNNSLVATSVYEMQAVILIAIILVKLVPT